MIPVDIAPNPPRAHGVVAGLLDQLQGLCVAADRIQRHEGYKTSLKLRKRIEEAFGWIKTVGGLAKTKLIGQAKLTRQALLCFATYNLLRHPSATDARFNLNCVGDSSKALVVRSAVMSRGSSE